MYSFCAQGGAYCTDGANPIIWNLIIDKSGNLYGTTILGGAHNQTDLSDPTIVHTSGYAGTVFELSPNVNKTNWTYHVLYSFCAEGGASCTDGRGPQSGVIMGPDGRLYGSASEGGAQNSNCRNGACGVIFELTLNAARSNWTEKVLYAFCKQGGTICADGANPHSGVRFAFGGLLGNADAGGGKYSDQGGGAPGAGTGGNVFLLTPDATGKPSACKVLYSFCSQPNCADGSDPEQDSLVVSDNSRIYGTTVQGGAPGCSILYGKGCGVVFELTPNAERTAWTERVVYAFCRVLVTQAAPMAPFLLRASFVTQRATSSVRRSSAGPTTRTRSFSRSSPRGTPTISLRRRKKSYIRSQSRSQSRAQMAVGRTQLSGYCTACAPNQIAPTAEGVATLSQSTDREISIAGRTLRRQRYGRDLRTEPLIGPCVQNAIGSQQCSRRSEQGRALAKASTTTASRRTTAANADIGGAAKSGGHAQWSRPLG